MDTALPPLTTSTLYLVATPIGNLEDITLRALRVLRECDVVAAEDTRHSGQLLKHFGISKPLLSYFQFNEARRSEEIIERLRRGEKVALVTDAGSPGISDPGERVVKDAPAPRAPGRSFRRGDLHRDQVDHEQTTQRVGDQPGNKHRLMRRRRRRPRQRQRRQPRLL